MRRKLTVPTKLEIPQVPNFIRGSDGALFSVGNLDDVLLRAIGREWTKKLIANAAKKRQEFKL